MRNRGESAWRRAADLLLPHFPPQPEDGGFRESVWMRGGRIAVQVCLCLPFVVASGVAAIFIGGSRPEQAGVFVLFFLLAYPAAVVVALVQQRNEARDRVLDYSTPRAFARMNACPNCGGSGIEASGERTERDEQESGKDAEARTVARRRACGWSQRDETGLDVLMVVPAESLAPEQRPCGVCGGPVEQLEGGAWVCVRRCAIPAPAVPEEGERWKITICNSCGRVADRAADGSAYCRWSQRHNPVNGGTFNQIMVVPEARATQAERERDELRKALRRIIADDTYATKIARTALHPQDSTERTDDA
jgi:hypothetical protein